MSNFFPDNDISCFTYVGAFVIFAWLIKISYWCFKNICVTCFTVNWEKLPKWAVITGGSDGIGRAYAEVFAQKGFNVALISRTEEKLGKVASELSELYHVQTRTVCVDFTSGPDIYEVIRDHLSGLQIGVLVNNVGMSYEYPEYFHAINNGLEVLEKLIQSNIESCTMMMRIVLPEMVARKKGVIINISSLMALYPMPLLSVYSASKAYVDYLARATHVEYKSKGIIIQSVLPGYVATRMSNRRTSIEVPSPQCFVQSAIKTVGSESYSFGYFGHKIRGFAHQWLKNNMPTKVNMAIAMYYMMKGRNRYLQRKNKISGKNNSDK